MCVCVWECTLPAWPSLSIWINVFALCEREILETAINNIIQLLGFVPLDMDAYCTHPHMDMTRGKLYEFSLRFLHIYYRHTSNHTPRSPSTATNAAQSERRVIQFPLCIIVIIGRYQNASQTYYKSSHYFVLKNSLPFPYELRGEAASREDWVHVWNWDVSAAALAEEIIYTFFFFFRSSTPYFN